MVSFGGDWVVFDEVRRLYMRFTGASQVDWVTAVTDATRLSEDGAVLYAIWHERIEGLAAVAVEVTAE